MEARNKKIDDWFSLIKQGHIVLPRFQRHEAWRPAQVVGLLENILRDPPLPVGALLTLDVGDRELFHSRPIVGARAPQSKPLMHLLDGQQRLTALWRTLTGDYPNLDIFVSLTNQDDTDEESDDHEGVDAPAIEAVKRWDRKGIRQPVWADDPVEVLKTRGAVPVTIFCPGTSGEKALNAWEESVEKSGLLTRQLIKRVTVLRQRIANYDVPFLSLDVKTGRATALNVFIKMNTSASPLKDFDIVVAQLESATGESLHDLVASLVAEVPSARDFGNVEDIILSVAALLMDRPPLKKTYLDVDYGNNFSSVWDRVLHGFRHGLEFIRSEAILNERCLPSDVAVYLTCALWGDVPEHAFDQGGNARSLIRKVLWRVCYTNRYGKTSATRAFADYKALKAMLSGGSSVRCDLFDEVIFPLPVEEELALAGWPGRKDRLPRAMMATSLRRGGLDFADGAKISHLNFDSREFHHLFPVQFLGGDRQDERVNRALNCALVTWTTNRKVGAKSPAEYIKARADAASLGEDAVKHRLQSHLIPYGGLTAGDYDAFLTARAKLIHSDMLLLCNGSEPQ